MSDDVLITPASRKIEFKDSGGNVDGTIQLDSSGNLVLTSTVGLLIGDLDADIHIGDGSNVVDMVFDWSGSIYSVANKDLTIGKSSLGGNDIVIDSPNWSVTSAGNATFSGDVKIPSDSKKLHLGASDDLQLYHDGSHSYVKDAGTGILRLDGSAVWVDISGSNILRVESGQFKSWRDVNVNDKIHLDADTGRVGINNTSPAARLDIIEATGAGSTEGDKILLQRYKISGGTGNQIYDSTYHVRNDDGTTVWTGVNWVQGWHIDNASPTVGFQGQSGGGAGLTAFQEVDLQAGTRFFGHGTDYILTIDGTNDRVGIGTTSPETVLHLETSSGQIAQLGTGNTAYSMHFADDRAMFGHVGGFATVQGGNGGKAVRFCVNNGTFGNGEVARFDTSGNFGIGTTSPNQILTLEGTMSLKEQASANADTAAYGQLWVKNSTPNELYFTTDAGDDIQLTSGTSIAGGGGGGAVDSIANFANNRVLTASDADSINGEANLVFDGTNLGIGEDDPGSLLEIRGATTIGTTTGHIMLTGDSATNGQGPQIVFSESGSGSSFAGAYIGHVRTGSNSMGDLVFATRQSGGNANTVPTEVMRMTGGTTPEITMATNISSTSKSAFNLMQKYYFQRSSMGTGTVDLRVPCGGDGSANPNNYPMPRAGKVVALTLHYYGGTIATGVETDVWEIRKYSGGSETTLDVAVIRQTLTNPTGNNYNITVELASPMNVAAGDWLGIRRDVSGGSVTHVSGILYVSFAG